MTVGEKIQALRRQHGMSQEELGKKLLVSRQTISQWEIGQTFPSIDNLIRLKEVFGVSVDEILDSETVVGSAAVASLNDRKKTKILAVSSAVLAILCLVLVILLLLPKGKQPTGSGEVISSDTPVSSLTSSEKTDTSSINSTSSETKKPQSTSTSSNSKKSTSSKPSSSKPSSSNAPTSSKPTNTITTAEFKEFLNKYEGRWYLEGYSDVYIDVKPVIYPDRMTQFTATNFSLPKVDDFEITKTEPYTIYPLKIDYKFYKSEWLGLAHYFQLDRLEWKSDLKDNKVELGENCFYVNGKKFVKEAGKTNIYSDTCYRDALGFWYLEGNPKSTIEITSESVPEPEETDMFILAFQNFNHETFSTENNFYRKTGYAAVKEEWDKYGISVKDGVLTITNSNGTRKFTKERPNS